jgi:hypothetical protein
MRPETGHHQFDTVTIASHGNGTYSLNPTLFYSTGEHYG